VAETDADVLRHAMFLTRRAAAMLSDEWSRELDLAADGIAHVLAPDDPRYREAAQVCIRRESERMARRG
jgi:hypothetical protein